MFKALIYVAIGAAVLFVGWKFAPDSIKTAVTNGLNKIGLSSVSSNVSSSIATSVRDSVAKHLPDDPVAIRAALLQKLTSNLESINDHTSSLSTKDKTYVSAALESSSELVQQIQDQNSNNGVVANSISKLVNAIAPKAPMCVQATN